MATTPNSVVTTQTTNTAIATCTTAKTDYGVANANITLLVTAGSDGAHVKSITAIPKQTITATELQLYLSKDSGVTLIPINSILASANTLSTTTAKPIVDFGYSPSVPLRLGGSDRVYAAISVAAASGICFAAQFENF